MKEVLQVAYLRHLQDFYLVESVKDGIISFFSGSSILHFSGVHFWFDNCTYKTICSVGFFVGIAQLSLSVT